MKRTFLIAALSFTSLALTAILLTVLGNGAALAMQDGPGINAPQQAEANLRVAHLAPFAADPGTAVTVTLDGDDVLTGFEFADSTVYFTQTAESHLVEIYAPGQPITPAITATVELEADTDYSAIAIGGANGWPLELLELVDDTEPLTDAAKIRIGHLAPFAALITDTLADIRLQDGTAVITNVAYKGYADIVLPAGTYDLKITTPGGDVTLIDPLPVTVADGDILSVFAVGDGVNQPLGVFVWPSNAEGFLLPLAFTGVDLSLVTTGTIYVGDEVEFSADLTPDNAYKPYTYTIDFDDGITQTATSSDDPLLFSHIYTEVGTYSVEIAVTNHLDVEPITDTVEVQVVPLPDFYLTKTVDAVLQYPGELVTYTIVFGNDGGPATGVVISDVLPAEVEFASANPPGMYYSETHELVWDLPTLDADARITATVVVTIGAEVAPETLMTNTAYLIYDEEVAVSDDVVHEADWRPIATVDLTLETVGIIYVGDLVEFSADLLPDNAGKPYTYVIDFGDGITVTASTSADPLLFDHTYTKVMTYTVEIQVWNVGNVEPVTDTVEVVVEPVMTYIYLPIIAKSF